MSATGRAAARRWRLRPSRIGLRLLAFNLLVVFLPVAGILYLDVYETRLLDAQERGMVQQARLLAAALGGATGLSGPAAQDLLDRFGRRGDARLRVFDSRGALIADSLRAPRTENEPPTVDEYESRSTNLRQRALYKLGAWLAAARRSFEEWLRPRAASPTAEPAVGADHRAMASELTAALQGRYGAATRATPGQRSLTLVAAVPVRTGNQVIGAVVVSQSTFRILQALYAVRLRIFEIVLLSLAAAALLTAIVSSTVVRPIVHLRRDAVSLVERRGSPTAFRGTDRHDEVGDLARALEDLTSRLDAHIKLLESFAADVAHEFKNPLASIRTAAEMIAQAGAGEDRARFLQMLMRDVDRLERLVSGVRELARIDAQVAHEAQTSVDVRGLVAEIIEGVKLTGDDRVSLALRGSAENGRVRGSRDRLAQVFENILQNARSFAPERSAIDVTVDARDRTCCVTIADRGPGIPEAHLDRVFDRFFSYRPNEPAGRREHAGLGLPIAKAIVQAYGGEIAVRNRPEGGALVEVCLPSTS